MINYDIHIHTQYCGHAETMTIAKILDRVSELSLDMIGISDHICKEEDLHIIERIKTEIAQSHPPCPILIGAEVDVDGSHCDGRLVTNNVGHLDYVIAGIHYIPGNGHLPRYAGDCPVDTEELLRRWRSTLIGVVSNPKVNILAHPIRMAAMCIDIENHLDKVMVTIAEAAKISAKNNIVWEINELDGTRFPPTYYTWWHEIYNIALNENLNLIYGSDAHTPENIAKTDFVYTILEKLPPNSLKNPKTEGIIKQTKN